MSEKLIDKTKSSKCFFESKAIFQKLILYFVTVIIGTFVYISFFRLLREEATKIPVVGAMVILLVVCLFVLTILSILRNYFFEKLLNNQDLIIVFLLLFFFNYNLYGMIPFNASRSNSIIMMEYLNSHEGIPKNKSEIQKYIEKVYFEEYDAVQRRLDEQVAAGNVSKTENGYTVTTRGKFIINIFAKITDMYGMENNFSKTNKKDADEK